MSEVVEWEEVCYNTYRMKVPSGWLIKNVKSNPTCNDIVTMCFVPDSNHKWGK